MLKPPSPQIATHGRSGAASFAPRMPAGPKPMPEKPQVLSMVCGRRACQNCMNQLWWTPESSEMMASSGSTARQSADHALGPHGPRVELEVRPDVGLPLGPPARDLPAPALQALRSRQRAVLDLGQQLAQEGARVGQDAERRRVVAAELGVIEVDVDQLRAPEIPGIARQPGGRRAVVEAGAERHHEVGVAAGLVRLIGAVAADEAERQLVRHVEAAHAVGRADHRNAGPLGQGRELRRGFGERHAVADEQDRAVSPAAADPRPRAHPRARRHCGARCAPEPAPRAPRRPPPGTG